jgi:FRG domain
MLERDLMARFKQRSIPYLPRDFRDDWDALFFMQHYGVPTRLLDWTENPLIGLYSALVASQSAASSGSAVVWVLNPFSWNQFSLSRISYRDGPLTTDSEHLKGYAPGLSLNTTMSDLPVALYGAHNSARIVAQQGAFTIFGSKRAPMESLASHNDFPQSALMCIVVHHTRIVSMRQSLLRQGITETVVFPDLGGLAQETKRFFGFSR